MNLFFFSLLISSAFSQTCQTDKTAVAFKPILNKAAELKSNGERFKHRDKEDLTDEKFLTFQKEMKKFYEAWDASMNHMQKRVAEFDKLDKSFEHRLDAFELISASKLDEEEDHYEDLANQALAKTVEFRTRFHDQLSNRFEALGKLDSIKSGLEKIEADRATHIGRSDAVVEEYKTMKMSFFKKSKKN